MSRAIVFGAGGLLGRELCRALEAAGDDVLGLAHGECDISRPHQVEPFVREYEPDVLYNAAAFTDVDGSERDPGRAYAANVLGPRVLVDEAGAAGARLIHVSTDYVFSGDDGRPYTELDRPAPRGVYALSKLAGEEAVIATSSSAIVVRTAWVFGPDGRNFVSKLPKILRERGGGEAVEDQWSSPTLASDLAPKLREIAIAGRAQLYHVVNPGAASYLEVAREAARLLGLDPLAVRPIASASLTRPAPRPRFSALASLALPAEGIAPLRPWREALADYISSLPSASETSGSSR